MMTTIELLYLAIPGKLYILYILYTSNINYILGYSSKQIMVMTICALNHIIILSLTLNRPHILP